MSPRFCAAAIIVVFAAALSATSGRTESGVAEPQKPPQLHTPESGIVEPPKTLPKPQKGDAKVNLDRLFEALKVAPDTDSAKYIEGRIWALWFASGSDTANLLMGRVKTAVEGKNVALAMTLLNSIIDIKPDFLEAWNRRATLYFMKKDYGAALADIHQVLVREPRHFGALASLGIILQEFGEDKRALDAYRRALAIHPHLERIPDLAKKLTEKVDGRDI